jgi:hypothetical protein
LTLCSFFRKIHKGEKVGGKMLAKKYHIIVTIFAFISPLFAIPDEYYKSSKEGYYFYQKDNEVNKTKPKMPHIPKDLTTLSSKEFEKLLEDVKGVAVMNPTKENVETYIKLQNFAMGRAQQFEKTWKDVILEEPELNIAVNNPNSTYSDIIISKEKEEKRKQFFKKHNDKLALVAFVANVNDERGRMTQEIVKSIKKDYGLTYAMVETDSNQALAISKGVKNLPDIFLVYKNSDGEGVWTRIGTGLIVKAELLNNIEHVAQRQLKLK